MEQLQINTAIQISKSSQEVFEAIIDPAKMSNYFIAEASGRMDAGSVIQWRFPEFPEWAPIKVLEVKSNQSVSYEWEGAPGHQTRVDIVLTEKAGNATLVKVTEGKMNNDEAGIKWLKGNTEGWANFLACMKAYLEYGINLRKGAFDFMKKENQ